MKRRDIIKSFGVLPFTGTFLGTMFSSNASGASSTSPSQKVKRNLLKELGVRTFINATTQYHTEWF